MKNKQVKNKNTQVIEELITLSNKAIKKGKKEDAQIFCSFAKFLLNP